MELVIVILQLNISNDSTVKIENFIFDKHCTLNNLEYIKYH